MGRTRLYRNDGVAMAEGDETRLEYIDPGVILLYADTGRRLVCCYVEGRLGQPIQATVEHRFDGPIALDTIQERAIAAAGGKLRVRPAPRHDRTSATWALAGLHDQPLALDDATVGALEALTAVPDPPALGTLVPRVLLGSPSGGPDERSGSDEPPEQPIDFAVRDVRDGARLFRFLVETLADGDVSIAVSKAGRVSTLEGADIVVHVDRARVPRGERVVPIGATADVIAETATNLRRERFERRVAEPLDALRMAFAERPGAPSDDVREAFIVAFNRRLGSRTGIRAASTSRLWRERLVLGLAGSGLGIVVGTAGGQQLLATVGRARAMATSGVQAAKETGEMASHLYPELALVAGAVIVLAVAILGVGRWLRVRYNGSHTGSTWRANRLGLVAIVVAFALLSVLLVGLSLANLQITP